MTELLDRDELIGLLNRLGSEDDEEALRAARQAHAQIAAAGASWADLLVPDNPAQESAQESAEEPTEESAEEPTEEPTEEPVEEPADESDESEETDEPATEADEADEDEPPGQATEKNAESLALIGELLARKDISAELRAELAGYKTDIAEGDFLEADRKYLRAVRQRLKK